MSEDLNRNAPCPCGSGKKYKNCCLAKHTPKPVKKKSFLTVVIVVVAIFAAGAGVIKWVNAKQNESPPSSGTTLQPPGPTPEGKVWSAEHGHYHNVTDGAAAPTQSGPISLNPGTRTPGPQPEGPAPEGKEWNEEHGHWHNKIEPGKSTTVITTEPKVEADTEEPELSVEVDNAPEDFEEVVDSILAEDAEAE